MRPIWLTKMTKNYFLSTKGCVCLCCRASTAAGPAQSSHVANYIQSYHKPRNPPAAATTGGWMKKEATLAANETLGLVTQAGILLSFGCKPTILFGNLGALPENLPGPSYSFPAWLASGKDSFSVAALRISAPSSQYGTFASWRTRATAPPTAPLSGSARRARDGSHPHAQR